MSQLLSTLVREHETILKALAALQVFAARHARRTPEPRKILGYFALFFRQYLDQWHHGKEESLLFPAMVDAGVPANSGPMGCMLREHEEGRNLLEAIAAMASGTGELTPRELAVLGELAVSYAQLLAHHVQVENQTLYPMAERVFSAEQLAALDASGAEIDGAWGQNGRDLQELGDTLAARFGAAPAGG